MRKFGTVAFAVLLAAWGFAAVVVGTAGNAAAEPPDPCIHYALCGGQ